ncbi:hypothetical protein BV898_05429 [Hypsibius exemplaris]|uniref:Uncharacterized protein n=1 Tax=Hypsibius exemplaris TaxID=2072580 RepID=A0A1W0WZG8_HYPEX|nr:hypothetical protein BV898_05429 [Hypsibius exemplaris]
MKRILGRAFEDAIAQSNSQIVSFTMISDRDGPKVPVREVGGEVGSSFFSPAEIATVILEELLWCATEFLGGPVTRPSSVCRQTEHHCAPTCWGKSFSHLTLAVEL